MSGHHYCLSILFFSILLINGGYARGWNDVATGAPTVYLHCSFTQGGYGSTCRGNSATATCSSLKLDWANAQPGCLRDKCFDEAFVLGNTTGLSVTFTSAEAIKNFLPQGGPPKILNNNSNTSAGVFSGQLLTAMMNVKFAANLSYITSLRFSANCSEIIHGLQNRSIQEVIYIANQVISGLSSLYEPSHLSDALALYNEAFDGCRIDARHDCFTSTPFIGPPPGLTDQPTVQPTGVPTNQLTNQPTGETTSQPTVEPTVQPTDLITGQPTSQPTVEPSRCTSCTYRQNDYANNCTEYHSWFGGVPVSTCASLTANWASSQAGCIITKCFITPFILGNTSGFTATFHSALDVQNFLPQVAPPAIFTANYANPLTTSAGAFAAELLTAMMNVQFSGNTSLRYADNCTSIAETLRGRTVLEVIDIANQVIGGVSNAYTAVELHTALSLYNNAFVGCNNTDPNCFTCDAPTPAPTFQSTEQACHFCTSREQDYGGVCHQNLTGTTCASLIANWSQTEPACIRDQCVASPFVLGNASLSGYTVTFTNATAIQLFLPQLGMIDVFNATLVDPLVTSAGPFASVLLTAMMNAQFNTGFSDLSGLFFSPNCSLVAPCIRGHSVLEIIYIANQVIANQNTTERFRCTACDLTLALDLFNNAFDCRNQSNQDCFKCNISTMAPTSMPTAMPTAMPTSMPTSMPTAMPTSMPTAMPCYFCTHTQEDYGCTCNSAQYENVTCRTLTDAWPTSSPGCIRDICGNESIVLGNVSSGSGYTVTFNTSSDVDNFLPQYGPIGVFSSTLVNPASSSAGLFAGQLLAATMNVKFSVNISDMTMLSFSITCVSVNEVIRGLPVLEVIYLANQVISNTTDYPAYTPVILTEALGLFNDAFTLCHTQRPDCFTCGEPTHRPTSAPTSHTGQPTGEMTGQPTSQPTREQTGQPTTVVTGQPTLQATGQPTGDMTGQPTQEQTSQPTRQPTIEPTSQPTGEQTGQPTTDVTGQPTQQPTDQPTGDMTGQPTQEQTSQPTQQPTIEPTGQPTGDMTSQPTTEPPIQECHFCTSSEQDYGGVCGQNLTGTTCASLVANWSQTEPACIRDQCVVNPFVLGNASFSGYTVTFTNATATQLFLPQAGMIDVFDATLVDPLVTSAGPFAGALLAAMMNVEFSTSFSDFSGLFFSPNCSLVAPCIRGHSVLEIIYLANQLIANQNTTEWFECTSCDFTIAFDLFNTALSCRNQTGQYQLPDCFVCNISTMAPTESPTRSPTNAPTRLPTRNPTNAPTNLPTHTPTRRPTNAPTNFPTRMPTSAPTNFPTAMPTSAPTSFPTRSPTNAPTNFPTRSPILQQTRFPTRSPTNAPTNFPTAAPTTAPTNFPTAAPTNAPTNFPTSMPTTAPTEEPTVAPTTAPTNFPTSMPTSAPTNFPTRMPTNAPTNFPTGAPTTLPCYFCTHTQEEYGCTCNLTRYGNVSCRTLTEEWPTSKPGCIRDICLDTPIVLGNVSSGHGYTATFNGGFDVDNFLPQYGPIGVFSSTLANPGITSAGLFGGQLLTAMMNVRFSVNISNMNELSFSDVCYSVDESIRGLPVLEVIYLANQVISNTTDYAAYTPAILTQALGLYNDAFKWCHVRNPDCFTCNEQTHRPTSAPSLSNTPNVPTHAPTSHTGQPTGSVTTNAPTYYSGPPTDSVPTNAPTSLTGQPTAAPSLSNTPGVPTDAPTSLTSQPTGAPTPCPTVRCPTCCGNGILERGEECDEGDANNNIYGTCTRSCTRPRCGDGIIRRCNSSCVTCGICETEEDCDDGNTLNGDGCSSTCRFENYFAERIPSMLSAVMDATTMSGNTPVHCKYLECVSPSREELDAIPADNLNLVYWLNNYCRCAQL